MYQYKTKGTCSQQILFDIRDGKVHDVEFIAGCHGNTQGVAALVEGMDVDEVISRLKGIRCGRKPTSCPDQLAIALENAKKALSPRGLRRLGRERDLYAVGKIIYMMLAHQSDVMQFPAIEMSSIQDITMTRLNAFLMQYACAAKRKRRFSKSNKFKKAFNECFKDYQSVEVEELDEEMDAELDQEQEPDTSTDTFADLPTELSTKIAEAKQQASQHTGEGQKQLDSSATTLAKAVPSDKRRGIKPIWIVNFLIGLLVLLLAIQVVYEWWKNKQVREYHKSPLQELKKRE